MQGLVTIAIPAYKRRWLAEAIDSALAQDYKNIELVIVNDHSPQNLDEVVEPYLSDPRVRYYVNEQNLGKESIVHNWNRCLELARGEYFVLLCDDDLLMPNFVSTLLALAEKYPQCNVFHGRRVRVNEVRGNREEEEMWPEYETYEEFLNNGGFGRLHTITEFMYRTDHAKKIGYVVYPLGWGSDDMSLLKFMQQGGISSSREYIACFRMSKEHISGSMLNGYLKAKARIQEYQELALMPHCPFTKEQIYNIIAFRVLHFFPYMTLWQKMKIIYHTPFDSWPLKTKIYMLLHANKYNPTKKSEWE